MLDRYRHAYSTLDVSGVSSFWPSVNSKVLGRAFDQLQAQSVTFDSCRIDIKGDSATSTCTGKASFTPKVGSRTARTESRKWTFQFARMPDKWIIVDVDAR